MSSCTDIGNGERFARDHGDDVRYCYERKRWLVRQDGRWMEDKNGEVERRAQQTALRIRDEAESVTSSRSAVALIEWASRSQTPARLNAMIWMARSALAITAEDFARLKRQHLKIPTREEK